MTYIIIRLFCVCAYVSESHKLVTSMCKYRVIYAAKCMTQSCIYVHVCVCLHTPCNQGDKGHIHSVYASVHASKFETVDKYHNNTILSLLNILCESLIRCVNGYARVTLL